MIPRRSKVKKYKLSSEHKRKKKLQEKQICVSERRYLLEGNIREGGTGRNGDKMHISAMKGNIVVYRKLCIIGKQKKNIFINKTS